MRIILSTILLALFFLPGRAAAQSHEVRTLDIKDQWMILESNHYRKWEGEDVRVVYFTLDAAQFHGDVLEINSRQSYSIFVNQMLIVTSDEGNVRLSVDSLAKRYSTPLSMSVFQESGIRSLSCNLIEPLTSEPGTDESLYARKGNYFLDFSLTASLVLMMYLVFLLGTNARQTLDYLNIFRVFSLQDRDENLTTSRVTSRINVLFYVFCCLFCSLTLLTAFYRGAELMPLAHSFPIHSAAQGFLQWLKLAVIVAILFFLKLVLVVLMSRVFNAREVAAVQYYQFVRSLVLATMVVALGSVLNFVFEGTSPGFYLIMLKVGSAVMLVSAGVVFLKLLGLMRRHFFHLFSYLCASEIIPLVIILKILLY